MNNTLPIDTPQATGRADLHLFCNQTKSKTISTLSKTQRLSLTCGSISDRRNGNHSPS